MTQWPSADSGALRTLGSASSDCRRSALANPATAGVNALVLSITKFSYWLHLFEAPHQEDDRAQLITPQLVACCIIAWKKISSFISMISLFETGDGGVMYGTNCGAFLLDPRLLPARASAVPSAVADHSSS